MREAELLEESRHAPVRDAEAEATCELAERARQVGLADAGHARDQDVGVLADPATGRERAKQRLVDLALGAEVDVLDARARDAQLGVAQELLQALVVARERLGFDEQREPLVERRARPWTAPSAARSTPQPS